jgi:hypothetical protein
MMMMMTMNVILELKMTKKAPMSMINLRMTKIKAKAVAKMLQKS